MTIDAEGTGARAHAERLLSRLRPRYDLPTAATA